ncbi:MAG: glutamine synthetase type III [Spirochaetes bacterium]|nr:MAG: glutamine synthetase type III [Spirochaetota bacterium]
MNGKIDFAKTPMEEVYGINLFSDIQMREYLPKTIYKELKLVQKGVKELSLEVAEVVASAMKDWATKKGATHYTHWFQPLTGLTAEKHDSFISPTEDGRVIMEFSGKELIKGEPDASSFPSGGLRATFEARGYTAWDTTSPAFLKEDNSGSVILCIPTAFVSYTGEALDKKVPLLRSMEAINRQALRILKALSIEAEKVTTTVGAEQEYFLINKKYYDERPDLILTGRTVLGAMPAKGQEMDDHYFGSIKEKAAAFMAELNYELWKLGISAKTQHNEVAPNQFELATIYDTTNVATDRNQMVMETMRKVANHHGLVALLHEKPFAGVNGSGKHNNWSLATDRGLNLLEPGDTPEDNEHFLIFLVSVIEAVDKYAPLLRMSAANPGNDHRLGANEAPPAIISIFLGESLTGMLEKMAGGNTFVSEKQETLGTGIPSIPKLPKDLTDRNRTSPFAFTGNKFEFRMVPSSISIAGANTVLNTAVADVLSEYADKLEKSDNVEKTIREIIVDSYSKHKRIIYNGNNYTEEWIKIAKERGLANIDNSVDAFEECKNENAVKLFTKHNVYTKEELFSRNEINLEAYSQQINVEAQVMIDLCRRSILPAVTSYSNELSTTILKMQELNIENGAIKETLSEISSYANELYTKSGDLIKVLNKARNTKEVFTRAKLYREEVFKKMDEVREPADILEKLMPEDKWPVPTYFELLFKL